MIDFLLCDLYRLSGDKSIKSFLKYYLSTPGFRFVVWLRICHWARRTKALKYTFFPFFKIVYNHLRYKYGYDIPYAIDIGKGLLLYHFGGIVVTAKSIGKNATISHCCTIGMKKKNGVSEFPIIGDNLYMAPGSKIVGGIKVGNNVAVGTNAVLMKSVEDNAVVVGIPGNSVSDKGSFNYIENAV